MATKKQLIPLMKEWIDGTGGHSDLYDLNDKEDFECFLEEMTYDLGVCRGCRWYFSAERSCEKETAGHGTCMNRLYKKLLEMKAEGL